jgi:hypothetical protein
MVRIASIAPFAPPLHDDPFTSEIPRSNETSSKFIRPDDGLERANLCVFMRSASVRSNVNLVAEFMPCMAVC